MEATIKVQDRSQANHEKEKQATEESQRLDLGEDMVIKEMKMPSSPPVSRSPSPHTIKEEPITQNPPTEDDVFELPTSPARLIKENHGQHEEPEAPEEPELGTVEQTFPLEDFDWQELETKFEAAMAEKGAEENQIVEQMAKLMSYYSAWAQTPVVQEEMRARKRLKTRITHVQHSEVQLQEKRAHHDSVVQAFKSALALLETI